MDQKSDGSGAKRGVKSDVPKTRNTRKTGHSAAKVIYRKKRTRRLHFDQVLDFSIHHFHQVFDFLDQKIIFEFFHTDENIFLHVIRFIRK
jgi:hypothetical protein